MKEYKLFTNRELASLVIAGAFIIWSAFIPGFARSLFGILGILASPIFVLLGVLYSSYSFGVIWLAESVGIWDSRILKDTIVVVTFVGIPMLAKSISARRANTLLRSTLKETFQASIFIVFYINLVSLNFCWELLIQLMIIFLGWVSVIGSSQGASGRHLVALTNTVIIFVVAFLLIVTTRRLIESWPNQNPELLIKSLMLSVWFPLLLLPYMYCLSFYSHSNLIFTRLKHSNQKKKSKISVRFALFLGLRMSIRLAANFDGNWSWRAANIGTFREARSLMIEFRNSVLLQSD